MSAEHDMFRKLELLNAEIDVLIDEEQYADIEYKLHIRRCFKRLIDRCFTDALCAKKGDKYWRIALSLNSNKLLKAGIFQLNTPRTLGDQKVGIELLRSWSSLFWAKLLRAKIQQRNTDCYLNRLDDVVGYLERNCPPEPAASKDGKDLLRSKLHFYYLMELSAASFDYGSIGYATRARRFLREFSPLSKTDDATKRFLDVARSWIALNEGISYLHLGNYHQASLEFNDIIWKYRRPLYDQYYFDLWEPQLLYHPSILYRATILLKQQLSYHAVRWLKALSELKDWSDYKKNRQDLLLAQAYRQMERRSESDAKLKKLGDRFLPRQMSSFRTKGIEELAVPNKATCEKDAEISEALCTRYVELVVNDLMERVRCVGFPEKDDRSKFRLWVQGKHTRIAPMGNDIIQKGLNDIVAMYDKLAAFFPWVQNNDMDRSGYYRQMAELLAWSARALTAWQDNSERGKSAVLSNRDVIAKENSDHCEGQKLIENLKGLIAARTTHILHKIAVEDEQCNNDGSTCSHCSESQWIILTHLRNDDYISLVHDLTSVLGMKGAEDCLDSLDDLKIRLERAVANKETIKGEDLFINKVNLRNDLSLYKPVTDCAWCMDEKLVSANFSHHFYMLATCRNTNAPSLRNEEAMRSNNLDHNLSSLDYDEVMMAYEEHFLKHLSKRTKHISPPMEIGNCQQSGCSQTGFIHFFGLRRWNSVSPAEGLSLGGGYLVFRTDTRGVIDLGLAVDPGYDFIKNLFHCGFSLADIDIILLSHSHPDHVRDFESIVNLLKELNDRTGQFRRVNVILTLGTYERLKHVFDNSAFRRHVEPLIIDIEKDIDRKYFDSLGPECGICFRFLKKEGENDSERERSQWLVSFDNKNCDGNLTVWPTRAYHDDYSGFSDSFGYVVDIPHHIDGELSYLRFGYTGDSKWVGDGFYDGKLTEYKPAKICEQYKSCDVVLVHMGSLIDHKNYQKFSDTAEKWKGRYEKLIRGKNHLYLPGLIGFLNEMHFPERDKPVLVLLSEFGEELRGTIRTDLVERLQGVYGPGDGSKRWPRILPVDVGLDVVCHPIGHDAKNDQNPFQFWCAQCRRFHPVENIAYKHYGQDEAIFYLCQTCYKTTSPDVLQDRLRHLYEVGRTLRTDDE